MESLPSYEVQPYQYDADQCVELFAGDIIYDKYEQSTNSEKYGFLLRLYQNTALVRWVTPDPDGYVPELSQLETIPLVNIGLHSKYLYLKSLHQVRRFS